MDFQACFVVCLCLGLTFATGCTKLVVSGVQDNIEMSGIYERLTSECDGEAAYEQVGGSKYYLYHHCDTRIYQGYWAIGPTLCSTKAHIRVADSAAAPQYVTQSWEEVKGLFPSLSFSNLWAPNPDLRVSCYHGFNGCKQVVIKNSTFGNSGIYSLMENITCYGRTSYIVSSGDQCLYFYHGAWIISGTCCQDYAYARSEDGALYPEGVTSEWEELELFGGWSSSPVTCTCWPDHSAKSDVNVDAAAAAEPESRPADICLGRPVTRSYRSTFIVVPVVGVVTFLSLSVGGVRYYKRWRANGDETLL